MFLPRTPLRTLARHFHQSVRCLSDKNDKPPNRPELPPEMREKKLQDWEMIDSSSLKPPPQEDPFARTHRILKADIMKLKKYIPYMNEKDLKENASMWKHVLMGEGEMYPEDEIFPSHCDVVIVGGGAIGSSIAYNLKTRARDGLRIVLLEQDKTYEKASSALSLGGLRQQFSLEENILMSLHAADFLRLSKRYLGDHVNVNYQPHGYLFMASEEDAEQLEKNSTLQNRLGAKNVLLSRKKLKERFPWLNVDDIALGCLGLEKEGSFDPWSLLMAYKHKAQSLGVEYIDGEAVNFEFQVNEHINVQGVPQGEYESTNHVIVKLNTGDVKRITFATMIIAAGPWSQNLAKLLRIGNGDGMLAVPLPIEPRRRHVYSMKAEGDNQPFFNSPLTIDPNSGAYFRCDGLGGNYLVGRNSMGDDQSTENSDVNDYFEKMISSPIAHRVPAFKNAKMLSSWSGFYDFNTFDENGIIGLHPYYHNVYFATGFSCHGIQQAPAVGRAISELILDGEFTTLDLSRLGFDRLMVEQPMQEENVV